MTEHRRTERSVSAGRIDYTSAGLTRTGHLVDMSRNGCRLELSGPIPQIGETVTLTFIAGVSVDARVVWEESGTVGLEFSAPIIDAVVRFFGLTPVGVIQDEVPRDGFGRKLPRLQSSDCLD